MIQNFGRTYNLCVVKLQLFSISTVFRPQQCRQVLCFPCGQTGLANQSLQFVTPSKKIQHWLPWQRDTRMSCVQLCVRPREQEGEACTTVLKIVVSAL